jgi:AcrR family transcriptional regulator
MSAKSRTPISNEDLLEAGWTIVQEELGWRSGQFVPEQDLATSTILSSIRARDVIGKAKVSPGAFYRRWGNIGDYLAELNTYILERKRHEHEYLAVALVAFERAAATGYAIPQIVLEVAGADILATSESIDFAIQMYLWSLCRRYPSIRALLAEQYAEVDKNWENKYSVILGLLGLRLRPDVSPADLSALITALAEGLAIRRVVDEDTASAGLLASGVMALLAATVDWDHDSVPLESWLGTLSSRDC